MYIFNVRVFQGAYVEAIHDIPTRKIRQIAQTVSANLGSFQCASVRIDEDKSV